MPESAVIAIQHTHTNHTAAKQISQDKLAAHTVNVTKPPHALSNTHPVYISHMHSQPFPITQTHTHIHMLHAVDPSLLNTQHALCDVPTSVGAACQLELRLFRWSLFVRLKANVISDTQQEPSDHPSDRSVAVMEKKKKKNGLGARYIHLTHYLSNIQKDRWL